MPSEREVYRAALERIVELAAPHQLWHELASAALAEGAALAENDTEAGDHYEVHYDHLRRRAEAAEARLAQITELMTPWRMEWHPRLTVEEVIRLARGEARGA